MASGIESPQSISSILYYRGVGMTITARESGVLMKPLIEEQMKRIDWLLDEIKCLPSWNKATNDEVKQTEPAKQRALPVEQFEDRCEKCGSKKGTSKAGNRYCLSRCWLAKEEKVV